MPITLNPYDQRDKAAFAERARLRGLADQARGDRGDLHRAYLDLITALANLKACQVSASFIDDAARLGHDAISDRDFELCRDIDAEAGPFGPLVPAEPLDLTDLEEFFEERA
jgi:hypothetical protein